MVCALYNLCRLGLLVHDQPPCPGEIDASALHGQQRLHRANRFLPIATKFKCATHFVRGMSDVSVENELKSCLKKYWGYSQFLEGQLDVCLNILRGKDSFVIMATGSGKSLTFQLPAVYLREKGIRSTAIVISPLISLIDDQISALLSMGIAACAIGSNSSVDIEARAMRGEFTVVYATPEKLLTWQHGLRELSCVAHIACLAVDESHCVSEWGHDFRPDYRRLGELRDLLGPKVPWVGLTASATVAVQADIVRNLRLSHPLVAKASLNRPNLKYCVITRTGPNDLLRLINEYRREQLLSYPSNVDKASIAFYPTLIYVNSKKETEELAKLLVECRLLSGIKVAYYHAGMQPLERSAVHMAFSKDEIQVVIATVAFGMGINKPDVRMVIHYGMTKSVESYYQQTGRAGRDGLPARCVLLFSRQDVVRCFNISSSSIAAAAGSANAYESAQSGAFTTVEALSAEEQSQQSAMQRLNHQIGCMKEFATTCGKSCCRRRYLMQYFGEPMEALDTEVSSSSSSDPSTARRSISQTCCDLCDEHFRRREVAEKTAAEHLQNSAASFQALQNMQPPTVEESAAATDISKEVHMLLSTIIACGEVFGIAVPLAVLLGKHDKSVQRVRDYAALPHFGCGTLHSGEWWKEAVHQLVDVDRYIAAVLTKMTSGFSYQRYIVTEEGRTFLAGGGRHLDCHNIPYDPAVHAYATQLARELQKQIEVEQNMKRRPIVQHAPQPQSALGRSKSLGNTTGSAKPVFSFLPESMAFDASKVAQYVQTGPGGNGGVQPAAAYNQRQILEKIAAELTVQLERQLRQTRNDIAQRSGLNPYNVLVTADIAELVRATPVTLEELAALPGWGDWKLRNFGADFVETIRKFKVEHKEEYAAVAAGQSEDLTTEVVAASGGGNTLFNGPGGSLAGSATAAPVVPVRPAVRLYRPNYEAAQQVVLDASTEVAPAAQTSSTAVMPSRTLEIEASPAEASAAEPVGRDVATGDLAVISVRTDSYLPHPVPSGQDATAPRAPTPSTSTGVSAYVVAAKKRTLASTGIAAFKAKQEVKLQRAHSEPTT